LPRTASPSRFRAMTMPCARSISIASWFPVRCSTGCRPSSPEPVPISASRRSFLPNGHPPRPRRPDRRSRRRPEPRRRSIGNGGGLRRRSFRTTWERETHHGRNHRCAGQGAAREDRRRDDGLQARAGRDAGRSRRRRRLAAQEGAQRRGKKAGRVAAEGLVGVATQGKVGAVVEVNAETDFVARNDAFQHFVRTATELALKTGDDIEKLRAAAFPGTGRTAGDELTHMIATIGENLALRRARRLEVKNGVVLSYIHNALAPGLGKIGVLVALESTGDAEKLAALGKQLAMHVAAAKPDYLDVASVDKAALDRERDVLREQSRASGKPEAIIEKMVEGRLRKFYEDVVLL